MNAFVRKASVRVSGELRAYESRSDVGNLIRRRFCPTCGTHMFSAVEEHEVMIVRVGTLDDRRDGKPQSYIWTASAPDWGHIDPDTPASPHQPNP